MVVTRKMIVEQLTAYLHQKLSLADLVDWAETAMMEAEFEEADFEVIHHIIKRLGLADVRAFQLSWDDCVEMLRQLGYKPQVEVVAV
jgi:cobyrinic acid a,c-diamide synthase